MLHIYIRLRRALKIVHVMTREMQCDLVKTTVKKIRIGFSFIRKIFIQFFTIRYDILCKH